MGKNKELTCPACGATVSLSDGTCPYCGSVIEIPMEESAQEGNPAADEIVLFSLDETEVKQKLAWEFAQDDSVPIDLFDALDFTVEKVYVPMWMLSGSYNASWACDHITYRDEVYYDREGKEHTKTIKERHPISGNAVGAFEMLVSAHNRYSFLIEGISINSKKFNRNLVEDDEEILSIDIDEDQIWDTKNVGDYIDEVTSRHVEDQIPDCHERLSSHVSYSRRVRKSVLLPYWILKYEYKGKEHTCIVRDDNGEIIKISHPKEPVAPVDTSDMKNPIPVGLFTILCIIVAIVCFFYMQERCISTAVESLIGIIFSIAAGIHILTRYFKESKSYKKLVENRTQKRHEERLNRLSCIPLLEPYRKEMEKVRDILTSSEEHNKTVEKDRRLKKNYLIVLLILLPVLIVSSYVEKNIQEKIRQERELTEMDNKTEFKINGIQYKVLSLKDMTVEVSNGRDCQGKIEIPSKVKYGRREYTVVQIGIEAFVGNQNIVALSMPNTVTSILSRAFDGCDFASFKPSENIIYVSANAFGYISKNFPIKPIDDIIYIGKVAYRYVGDKYRCSGISIKEGTQGISNGAFQNCKMEHLYLPSSLKYIGISAFNGCSNLKTLKIPQYVEYIGEEAFSGCYNLSSILVSDRLLTIGKNAFKYTEWHKDFEREEVSTEIVAEEMAEEYALPADSSEQPVTEPETTIQGSNCQVVDNLIYIGSVLYGYKESIPYGTEIVVREGTKGIAESAFSGCSGIVSVKLPDSMVCIGKQAFENCRGLEHINFPKNLKMIGNKAFNSCNILDHSSLPEQTGFGRGVYWEYSMF